MGKKVSELTKKVSEFGSEVTEFGKKVSEFVSEVNRVGRKVSEFAFEVGGGTSEVPLRRKKLDIHFILNFLEC